MSSQDIALYLYEIGSNERKLEYCRQILASNTNFIPEALFNINFTQTKATISKKQFIQILKTANISCVKEQEELIYSYFQIDDKNYLTYDQFVSQIIPYTDQSLKKLISKRDRGQFQLDYGLKFALQKLFLQIVQNQVKLQLLCKFTFEKGKDEKKLRAKRLDVAILKEFLGYHDKYPSQSLAQAIVRQISLNKGENKRNKIIAQYILQYTDKKRKAQELPKVYTKQLSAMKQMTIKYQNHIESFQKKAVSAQKGLPALPSSLMQSQKDGYNNSNSRFNNALSSINHSNTPLNDLQIRKLAVFTNPTVNISGLQDRIKQLMNSVNTKKQATRVSKVTTPQSIYQPLDKSQVNENQTIRKLKQQIKKEKLLQKSGVSQKNSNQNSLSKRKDYREQGEKSPFYNLQDSIATSRNAHNYDRNKVDSIYPKYSRISQQNERSSNASSQLIMKSQIKNISKVQKGKQQQSKIKKNESQSQKLKSSPSKIPKYNYDVKQKNEHKKRIEYLKNLIQQKEEQIKY